VGRSLLTLTISAVTQLVTNSDRPRSSKQGQKRAGAAKPRKTAASPAPGHTALACGNAACGKALGPPLLQCFKCKAEAYCCKACQVGDPAGEPESASAAAAAAAAAAAVRNN